MFTYLWKTSTKHRVNSQSGVVSLHPILFTFWHTLLFSLYSHVKSWTSYFCVDWLKKGMLWILPSWNEFSLTVRVRLLYVSTKVRLMLEFPLAAELQEPPHPSLSRCQTMWQSSACRGGITLPRQGKGAPVSAAFIDSQWRPPHASGSFGEEREAVLGHPSSLNSPQWHSPAPLELLTVPPLLIY